MMGCTQVKYIKSPLRYPGGKTRAVSQILSKLPEFTEYREPFLGGGSVFLAVKSKYPQKKFWINDLNEDLACFWQAAKKTNVELVNVIEQTRNNSLDGKSLFRTLRNEDFKKTAINRASRFFILNRITFSGTIDSGGFSQESFEKRFTQSSIERVRQLQDTLHNTRITNVDYEELLKDCGPDTFLFLDPPYHSLSKSKLYGFHGNLHLNFDHERFAESVIKSKANWLITYDNCEQVRDMFRGYKIEEWTLQYGMNSFNHYSAKIGKEIFISNY